jgi:hypothetical protein
MAAVLNCTVGHVVTSGVCFLKRFPISNRRGLVAEPPFGTGRLSTHWLPFDRARGRMRSCAAIESRVSLYWPAPRNTPPGNSTSIRLAAPTSIVTDRRLATSLNDEQKEGLAPRARPAPKLPLRSLADSSPGATPTPLLAPAPMAI